MPITLSEVLIGLPYFGAADAGVAMEHDLLCGPVGRGRCPLLMHVPDIPWLAKGFAFRSASVIMSESRVVVMPLS
jgi:hypothetical protein